MKQYSFFRWCSSWPIISSSLVIKLDICLVAQFSVSTCEFCSSAGKAVRFSSDVNKSLISNFQWEVTKQLICYALHPIDGLRFALRFCCLFSISMLQWTALVPWGVWFRLSLFRRAFLCMPWGCSWYKTSTIIQNLKIYWTCGTEWLETILVFSLSLSFVFPLVGLDGSLSELK